MFSISQSGRKFFEDYLHRICEFSHAAGMAVAVIDSEGETHYEHFHGLRDLDRGLPLDENTIFGLASVSKSFVALSIMQLQEKGLLSVDDPVSRYLPEFSNRNQKTVRIRHLLSHSAGFYPVRRTLLKELAAEMHLQEDRDGDFSLNASLNQKAVERVCSRLDGLTPEKGLIAPPGRYMSYCNDGFGLLSEIVRRVSGERHFADYVRKKILDPLEMGRSSGEYLRPRQQENVSLLYQYKDGRLVGSSDSYEFAFALPGAGAMKSTLADMKKYVAMYLRNGRALNGHRILSGDGIRRICRPEIELNTAGYYCFGLETVTLENRTAVRHGGSQPGVSSHILFVPQDGLGIIVLCNTSNVPAGLVAEAALRMSVGKNPPPERTPALLSGEWSPDTMQEVQGVYASEEGVSPAMEFRQEKDGILLLQNGIPADFQPAGRDCGLIRGAFRDSIVRFFRDDDGRIFAVSSGDRMLPRAGLESRNTSLFF